MTTKPFDNRATQAERKAALLNNTLLAHAMADADMAVGGRFAAVNKTRVVGTGAVYPQLPATSPWSKDPVPDEEPLGIDVNEAPLCGEPHELDASRRQILSELMNGDATEISAPPPIDIVPSPVVGAVPLVAVSTAEAGRDASSVVARPQPLRRRL